MTRQTLTLTIALLATATLAVLTSATSSPVDNSSFSWAFSDNFKDTFLFANGNKGQFTFQLADLKENNPYDECTITEISKTDKKSWTFATINYGHRRDETEINGMTFQSYNVKNIEWFRKDITTIFLVTLGQTNLSEGQSDKTITLLLYHKGIDNQPASIIIGDKDDLKEKYGK